jgi:DNA repair protein RadC
VERRKETMMLKIKDRVWITYGGKEYLGKVTFIDKQKVAVRFEGIFKGTIREKVFNIKEINK